MSTVVAFPSAAIFGQQAALAFLEVSQLSRFETTFAYSQDDALAQIVRAFPSYIRDRVEPNLRRRALNALPKSAVRTSPTWEVVRTISQLARLSPTLVDRIWDHMSHDFTRGVASRLTSKDTAIYAFEYTALEAFEAARDLGVKTILDFPSLNGREYEQQQDSEKMRFPELIGRHDSYFKARFERRQSRRDAEMHLADLIITNSSLTRASHIKAGAPAEKTVAVPYGAPQPVTSITSHSIARPLKLVWAGTFSIRKGAHYLIDALARLGPQSGVEVEVYGAIVVPDRVWRSSTSSMKFFGSVTRDTLFAALDAADALIFPTLSDGFGMVVTEAFARGLPVITTNRAGAADLIKHGKNGLLVPAGDTDALADTITWCIENREALAAMRTAALQSARDWQWSDYRRALRAAVQGDDFSTPSTPKCKS